MALYAAGALVVVASIRLVFPRLPSLVIFLLTLVIIMSVGFVLELLQTHVPNRAFDLIDLAGDFVGASLALAVVWFLRFRFAR
jgi:VanZ family protein